MVANNERFVVGLDAGGTKTAAVVMNDKGAVLGLGYGGSGNTNFIALSIANKSFADCIGNAAKMAGIKKLQASSVVVGTEPDPAPVAPVIARMAGTKKIVHRKEGECSLVGGLVEKTGLSLIDGTGSVGWGRNAKGETSMTSCWGPLGDEGSAYDMARRGVNAAFWGWDGRGPKTILIDKLLQMFKQKDLRDVCTPLYTSENMRKDFASLSRMVAQAAEDGDKVAQRVMQECAAQVAWLLAACANNLKMGKMGYKVAMTGGMVANPQSRYYKLIRRELTKIHPKAILVPPRFEPVVGAGLIALDIIGVGWDAELARTTEKTWVSIKRKSSV
jgi:N-acetylglucosamine kinase